MNKSEKSCCCSCSCKRAQKAAKQKTATDKHKFVLKSWQCFLLFIVLCVAWVAVYWHLAAFSSFLVGNIFYVAPGTHLNESLTFFFYDTPKVLMLLVLVVFGVGLLRSFISPEKTRKYLAGRSEFVGNILAAMLGIITPFCSCSAVPLFIGFVTAGVPLGVTFSFLIAAPMVNEVALILLFGLVGWKVAAIYLFTGLLIAIISGFVIGRLHMEKHIEEWVKDENATSLANADCCKSVYWADRFKYAWQAVKDIVGKVWLYMVLGIAVGAGIHGYVPQSLMVDIMGRGEWWSVPLAVIIGVPIYANAAGIIPVVEAILGKGAALGTTLAFMMSVVALSLPEMVILRRVLKLRLIFVFIGVTTLGILFIGYIFNWMF